ncbi:hypothetical protein AB832_02945 [Flavobacteriaceae bacterium (ex Bugula neritina AB1)]|nr:hypothetical protein AB832_02945 [Flavobacteriaceae bacterium (ex Bugula neritina AB1)]
MTTFTNTPGKNLKNIHFDVLGWKSNLQFIQGEILFIHQLLNSYVFEPVTPNLFERLQEYRQDIKIVENAIKKLNDAIKKHENELGGILDCDTISYDDSYYDKHHKLKNNFEDFCKKFQTLKSKVFSYAGGVLKRNKK